MVSNSVSGTVATGEGEFIFSRRELALIAAVALVAAVVTFFIARTMERAYKAEVIVMFAEDEDSGPLSSGVGGQLGNVASLFGASFGSRAQSNEALATLRSRAL